MSEFDPKVAAACLEAPSVASLAFELRRALNRN